jgi:cell filamentation protein
MYGANAHDPYTYAGTDVLVNKQGIHDAEHLRLADAALAYLRLAEMYQAPVAGAFDLDHLRAIHRRLFGDLYEWAGELRTVSIAKNNSLFALPAYLGVAAGKLFDELRRERYLVGLPHDEFTARLAYYLGELNALHPFREGNGRTQREFTRLLALHAGFHVAWEDVSRAEMVQASIEAMAGRLDLLEVIMGRITTAVAQ